MTEESIKIGEQIVLDSEPHFVTGFDNNSGVILETFKEVCDKSNCKGCKYFFKEKGWIFKEIAKRGLQMPYTLGCKLGQFGITHNPTRMPKECKVKNYIYSERDAVKEHLFKVMKGKDKDAYIFIEPSFFGINVFDLKNVSVNHHIIRGNFKKYIKNGKG